MTPSVRHLLHRPPLRTFKNHPRLLLAAMVGAALYGLSFVFTPLRPVTCMLIAWNAAALSYIGMALSITFSCDTERMHRKALLHDEGENLILIIATLASVLSLVAIVAELATTKSVHGWLKAGHIGLSILTLLSSWTFIHMGFAFHYAHAYYVRKDHVENPPLIFPETTTPHYMDFLYFAFVIGTSGQTADVSFASAGMRRIGLIHCILSYGFNATVLALMINIAAGLIS